MLNKIRIKTRILLLVFIPLVVTAYLSFERYQKANDELQALEKIELLLGYLEQVSPVISALQQEWSFTKNYLGPGQPDNPIGLEYKQGMMDARAKVDTHLSSYLAFVENKKADLQNFKLLNEQVNAIKVAFDVHENVRKLASLRQKSSKQYKTAEGNMIWTLFEIKRLVERLIDSTNQVVLLSAQNPRLVLLANAYQNLTLAKHISAIQTGTVETAITSFMYPYIYGQLVKNEALEKLYRNNFLLFASDSSKHLFNKTLFNTDFNTYAAKTYESLRRDVTSQLNKKIEIDIAHWLSVSEKINSGYQQVVEQVVNEIVSVEKQLLAEARQQVHQTLIVLCLLILMIAGVSYLIIRSINKPIQQMELVFTELAQNKDMSYRIGIQGEDELSRVGIAFNSLVESFEIALKGVFKQAFVIDQTTSLVSSAMAESMSLSNRQKEATESVSVAVNQMSATIEEVSEMAQATSDTVQRAHNISIESENNAQVSKDIMQNLITELAKTSDLVRNLNNEAAEISQVLNVIQAISEQTNLLALNAAIEAARAGEMGRGFAVVADEVRNLAQRTQDSTQEIRGQIESLVEGAETASNNMIALQENGQQAIQVVIESTDAFAVLKNEFDQITQMASQIAVAAEEQSSVSNDINERVHAIKDDTDSLTAHANNTLEATKTLTSNGHKLVEHIKIFKISEQHKQG